MLVLIPNEQFFVLILFQYSLTKSEHLFNLKFAAKDLERNAKKCEKSEKEEKGKLKKVIFFFFFLQTIRKFCLSVHISITFFCSCAIVSTSMSVLCYTLYDYDIYMIMS